MERKKAKVAVLIGEDEMKQGKVTLKRIRDQYQISVAQDDLIAAMDTLFEDEHEVNHHEQEMKGSDAQ